MMNFSGKNIATAGIIILISGCSNLHHQAAMNVFGGLPVNPTCMAEELDWTRLKKNDRYFIEYQKFGIKIKEGDVLEYVTNDVKVTAQIRATERDEYSHFSGYVVSYKEVSSKGSVEYKIPVTQDVSYQKVKLEMCGGANKIYLRSCLDLKSAVEKDLVVYFYDAKNGDRPFVLNLYKNGIFPKLFIDLIHSKHSYSCNVVDGFRDFEKRLYEENISCYRKTGNFCTSVRDRYFIKKQ